MRTDFPYALSKSTPCLANLGSLPPRWFRPEAIPAETDRLGGVWCAKQFLLVVVFRRKDISWITMDYELSLTMLLAGLGGDWV